MSDPAPVPPKVAVPDQVAGTTDSPESDSASPRPSSGGLFKKHTASMMNASSFVKTLDVEREAEKIAIVMRKETNATQRRENWNCFLHSKVFLSLLDDTFYKACHLMDDDFKKGDNQLDASELQVSMDILHDKLGEFAHLQLPESRETAKTLLPKFDIDGNGKLDLEEFRRFAQVYFNRLNWSLWQIAGRGAILGMGTFLVTKFVVVPTLKPVLKAGMDFIIPKVMQQVRKVAGNRVSGGIKKLGRLVNPVRFIKKNPTKTELAILAEKAAHAKKIKKAIAFLRNLTITTTMGGMASCAGII